MEELAASVVKPKCKDNNCRPDGNGPRMRAQVSVDWPRAGEGEDADSETSNIKPESNTGHR